MIINQFLPDLEVPVGDSLISAAGELETTSLTGKGAKSVSSSTWNKNWPNHIKQTTKAVLQQVCEQRQAEKDLGKRAKGAEY